MSKRSHRVVIVGFGRMGGALARGLRAAGWPVQVLPRSGSAVRRAVQERFSLADDETLYGSELCILAVPDDAIAQTSLGIQPDLGPKTMLVHCSGASSLQIFGKRPTRPVGSFHPLAAISDPSDELHGHSVALAASSPKALAPLRAMARALNMVPLDVSEKHRAAYHAAAVLSAGLLMTQLELAVETMTSAGVPPAQAQNALISLAKSALRGVERRGIRAGLTGPIARKDWAVVHAHIRSLPPAARATYRELSARMAKVLKLSGGSVSALRRALR